MRKTYNLSNVKNNSCCFLMKRIRPLFVAFFATNSLLNASKNELQNFK